MTATVNDVFTLVKRLTPNKMEFTETEIDAVTLYLKIAESDIRVITGGRWDDLQVDSVNSLPSYCDHVQLMAAYRFYLNPTYESQHQLVEMVTRAGVGQFIGCTTSEEERKLTQIFSGMNGNIQIINFQSSDLGGLQNTIYDWRTGGSHVV